MGFEMSNDEKAQVWQAYERRRPTRVPVRMFTNPRVVLLDPGWNPDGITFEQAANDPRTHLEVSLRHQLHVRTVINRYTDGPTGLPDEWVVGLNVYNFYEAAFFGAEVRYTPGQVPSTEPFLDENNKWSIFDVDIEHPLDRPFIRHWLAFWNEMNRICVGLRFEGRPVRLAPWLLSSTDGPVTVGCNLRGSDFLTDLLEDPEYADRLMATVIRAAIHRRRAFSEYWGQPLEGMNMMADDSIAMLSPAMVRQRVLPLYREFYEAGDRPGSVPRPRGIHLCGDATKHFQMLHDELGVEMFDTGFPVDHGALRRQLGPDVEIAGGPEVALLLNGTPDQVFQRTRDILLSGIKEGGRFILEEGNNLPPRCPEANLEAFRAAALEFGGY
jgi:hypothetical protein